jgi:hypothetical protein
MALSPHQDGKQRLTLARRKHSDSDRELTSQSVRTLTRLILVTYEKCDLPGWRNWQTHGT